MRCVYPFKLSLNITVESLKLFGVIKGWELPEDLFYSLHDDWVSELKDVGRDDEDVDEVND
jgi:hypothetical protein